MSLKIEDIQVGDELVCIDEDYYLKHLRFRLVKESKVSFVYDHSFKINDCLFLSCDLKYFKKKEQYTFDDLINISSKAVKDGLFASIKTDFKRVIQLKRIGECDDDSTVFHNGKHNVDNYKFIQSLYKETFVIETVEDIKNIEASKRVDSIKLANDMILSSDDLYAISHYTNDFLLKLLKGATVEQERGCNE